MRPLRRRASLSARIGRAAVVAGCLACAPLTATLAQEPLPPVITTPALAVIDSIEGGVSPRGAFFRSLVLPGWGQSVTGSPGRGAVYFALEAGSLWMAYKSRTKLSDARLEEAQLRDAGLLPLNRNTGLVVAREEQFEDWATLSIFLLFFSAADAFVSAYLADFDEHLRAGATADAAVQIEGRIPVGGGR